MSHLTPGERSARHKISSCKKGKHLYGEPQNIGAGIVRQVCLTCAAVSIDLTGVDASIDEPVVRPHRKISSLGNSNL
jgi:hypothetical protein